MDGARHLEMLMWLQGDVRRSLGPIRVTPLQASVLLFLGRHAGAKVTDAARARGARLSEVVKALVRSRWVIRHRSVTDTRVVHLLLSHRGRVITRKIETQVRQVSTGVAANKDLTAAGLPWLQRVPAKTEEALS